MQSKRDQVQAHSFVMGRLTSGMLLADPDAPESPLARTTRGVLMGCLVTVLVGAGAFVYGLVSPGGDTSWKTQGTLVVNRETGARYLYLDGRLRPVRNYASALLVGGGELTVQDVRTSALRGTPVGAPVGIAGAPDSVPAASALNSGAWQVCSGVTDTGGSATTLVAGAPAAVTPVAAGRALLVSGPDRARYLVWQGSRLRLGADAGTAASLGYGSATPRPVSAAFLDALVAGPGLAAPDVPGRGSAGPVLSGTATRVGQVFRVRVPGSGAQYYLLREEGFVELTETGAALVLGDPATRAEAYGGAQPAALTLGADLLAARLAPAGTASGLAAGLPASPPRLAATEPGTAVCAQVEPGRDGATGATGRGTSGGVRVTSVLVPEDALAPVAQGATEVSAAPCLAVDRVVVGPGSGVLVRALDAGGTQLADTTYLVADDGVKYRVPDSDALTALGYGEDDAVTLPSTLLAMLASGPDLLTASATGERPVRTTRPVCAPADPDRDGGLGMTAERPGGITGR
ncbi:type VII secretion protein EccB [Streptomyces sp. NPDC090106]|uniref:type VII secretion protein EccB n=1 Tax=Streptomyces sp. NPDC090106 TaxID=3365946 RepID=UPI003802256C